MLLSITRFIDCNAFKYSISLNFPIPGFTALDQVKKIPAINPVNNIAINKIIDPVFMFFKVNKFSICNNRVKILK